MQDSDMDLISLLVSNPDVSEDRSTGVAGMLFKLTEVQLNSGESAQITDNVSGIDDTLSAAPAAAGGGLISSVDGGSGNRSALAYLACGFDRLGMDSSMTGKFVPVVLDVVRNPGGDGVGNLL